MWQQKKNARVVGIMGILSWGGEGGRGRIRGRGRRRKSTGVKLNTYAIIRADRGTHTRLHNTVNSNKRVHLYPCMCTCSACTTACCEGIPGYSFMVGCQGGGNVSVCFAVAIIIDNLVDKSVIIVSSFDVVVTVMLLFS